MFDQKINLRAACVMVLLNLFVVDFDIVDFAHTHTHTHTHTQRLQ